MLDIYKCTCRSPHIFSLTLAAPSIISITLAALQIISVTVYDPQISSLNFATRSFYSTLRLYKRGYSNHLYIMRVHYTCGFRFFHTLSVIIAAFKVFLKGKLNVLDKYALKKTSLASR